MIETANKIIRKVFRLTASPEDCFLSYHYRRHTQRRLEHLATLGLDIAGSTVLEVGAGVGDHTSFFLDRECKVVSTEGRRANLAVLRARYPNLEVLPLDLDHPNEKLGTRTFDIVYCYGVLYHLVKPAEALEFLARHCRKMILLETCVSFGQEESINPCAEVANDFSQGISGQGCRPTRKWVYGQIKRHFQFVYMPLTQPCHEEFPMNWTSPETKAPFNRAIFIGSRSELLNSLLSEEVPMRQRRS